MCENKRIKMFDVELNLKRSKKLTLNSNKELINPAT